MEQVYLSLGSNLGDRLSSLQQAIDSLRDFGEIGAVAHAYESEPVEFTAQPWFLNSVVAVLMNSDPLDSAAPLLLLDRLLAMELALGRRRGPAYIPKGPRVIDIDIVLYGSRSIHTPPLTVPHPAMHLRRFVLQPLAEIAPEVEHPDLHKSALQLFRELSQDGPIVRRFAALRSPKGH